MNIFDLGASLPTHMKTPEKILFFLIAEIFTWHIYLKRRQANQGASPNAPSSHTNVLGRSNKNAHGIGTELTWDVL